MDLRHIMSTAWRHPNEKPVIYESTSRIAEDYDQYWFLVTVAIGDREGRELIWRQYKHH